MFPWQSKWPNNHWCYYWTPALLTIGSFIWEVLTHQWRYSSLSYVLGSAYGSGGAKYKNRAPVYQYWYGKPCQFREASTGLHTGIPSQFANMSWHSWTVAVERVLISTGVMLQICKTEMNIVLFPLCVCVCVWSVWYVRHYKFFQFRRNYKSSRRESTRFKSQIVEWWAEVLPVTKFSTCGKSRHRWQRWS